MLQVSFLRIQHLSQQYLHHNLLQVPSLSKVEITQVQRMFLNEGKEKDAAETSKNMSNKGYPCEINGKKICVKDINPQ